MRFEFEFPEIENEFIEIELPPGLYEKVEVKNAIKQTITDLGYKIFDMETIFKRKLTTSGIEFHLEADTIPMNSDLTTSNSIIFNSELNKRLGFTSQAYPTRTHKSEKPILISSVDKVHLKCDCVDCSIVSGIRKQRLY